MRRYGDPITVTLSDGQPAAFTWHGQRVRVHVIGRWRLRARWWESAPAAERMYYRVQTADWRVFELYVDAAGAWVLDVCHD